MERDSSRQFDVVILGAGGAGMMCAIYAGNRGKRVLILDHSPKAGGKILISGGGRCNFTNLKVGPENFYSQNPHFAKSALARFPPENFIDLVKKHKIPFHEKKLGQLFCNISANQIVQMLLEECRQANVEIKLNTKIKSVNQLRESKEFPFTIETSVGEFTSQSLVVATGGLSIPRMGATGMGYDIAKQFGHKIVKCSPALDGFVLNNSIMESLRELAGSSLEAEISTGSIVFKESLLFTHVGISGPVALQASLYWQKGSEIKINLLPGVDIFKIFKDLKTQKKAPSIRKILERYFTSRMSEVLSEIFCFPDHSVSDVSDKFLQEFSLKLTEWSLIPDSTVGYTKAEVTRGGVDTQELSSKTLESKRIQGLYFVGEVVDVTGWLGGYNFQWAWASGAAAGNAV